MKRFPTLPLLAMLLAGALFLSSCGEEKASSANRSDGEKEIPKVSIRIDEIEPQEFTQVIEITGAVASDGDVMVPADEGGRVLNWRVPLGAHVQSGQVLVQLDSALLRSAYDAALAQYNIAQTSYEKQARVYEEQGISELQLKTLQYQRDAAKAGMELARERLQRCSVRSPISGVLNQRLVEKGEMSAPGMPIAHVVNTSSIKLKAGIPERYASAFRTGDPVTFTVDAIAGKEFNGKITFVGAAVNTDNRTIPVEVHVSNAGGGLKPSMIADMTVRLRARENSIVVPEDYIIKNDMDSFVVYIEQDGKAVEREVKIGGSSRGNVLILDGLRIGDRLITTGQQHVSDGQPVMVEN
ncbi:efflux RND transporter periplasmic adaptor subunit [bacterium]|nr:efflux RND transporter periplasmic adaptor subunit [bacterium]